ncbi:MAG: hypothetical protein JSV09_12995 [Thermoplasmata archaeon]|nr:MAG: hypothetical protein JSV09_12995 [Thermoplasmata archaeon]
MKGYYPDEDIKSTPSEKKEWMNIIIKVLAIILVVLSMILLIWGLIPHDRVDPTNKTLQGGYTGCYTGVEAKKGDILEIKYYIDGADVTFYLTYGQAWSPGSNDYVKKIEHASSARFQVDIDKSGIYYLNFNCNDPSSSGSFDVDLTYKIMDRYSPIYIVFSVISLVGALILTVIYLWLKKRPPRSDRDYIRL